MNGWSVQQFGTEREPICVLDGFTGDVGAVIADAEARSFVPTSPHYPGIRAPAPIDLIKRREADIVTLARDVFGVGSLAINSHDYSLVTTAPGDLAPIQRLPHFDGLAPQLALLVYLRPAGQGGTAFFRQRATGFETVTAERFAEHEAALKAGVASHGLSDTYHLGDSPLYEQIGTIEAVPDRAVLYRGRNLHSGIISDPSQLSSDPRVGRLTLNTFFAANPA